MKGFTDLDLSHLIGGQVAQVCKAQSLLSIHLEPRHFLVIERKWRILDADGRMFDEGDEQKPKDAYRAHRLIGKKVVRCKAVEHRMLSVTFDDGWALLILDDERHQSVHISPDIRV